MSETHAHRRHSRWKNYREKGIYHITIVVNSTLQQAYPIGSGVLGTLKGISAINGAIDEQNPRKEGQNLVELSEVGKAVEREWWKLSAEYQKRGMDIRIIAGIVMPDHFHGVIYAAEELPQSIGHVIAAFKARCTQAYVRAINGAKMEPEQEVTRPYLHNMSRAQRATYYETLRAGGNVVQTPLFEDNYDDTILMHKGQLQAMIDYVHDNPRRAIIRMTYPNFYERRLHIWIDGVDAEGRTTRREYAAFGNLFLLRYPWKEQVMCHRWKMNGLQRDYKTAYIDTDEYRIQHDELIRAAEDGAVLVTPGISKGEQRIKEECLTRELPLIHLQKEPIDEKWKPEKERFNACEKGNLLILAPWGIAEMADRKMSWDGHTESNIPAATNYSQFHNMNDLAAEICRGTGSATLRIE